MNDITSRLGRAIGDPKREIDHFYRCGHCGQYVDARDLSAVLRHEQPDHEPDQSN